MGTDQSVDGEIAEGDVVDGRFELVEAIGGGRRGKVWRATRIEDGRKVVVKVLERAVASDPGARRRFEREADAAARVAHPNCAAINDIGALEDGRLFLVTDYFDGELLSAYLHRKQKLPLDEALRITRHVLCGLRHAHGAGVVHRDVRPGNVMLVERDGEQNVAVLLDFGLAKLIGNAGAGKEALTAVGLALGDISYASPEQMEGASLDGRADLYAVTAVLVQMLTGSPPPLGGEGGAHVDEGLDIPVKAKELVHWGLERDPMRRIPSADRYIAELDSILGDRAPSIVPTIAISAVPPPEQLRPAGPPSAGPDAATLHMPSTPPSRSLPPWTRTAGLVAAAVVLLFALALTASQCEDTDALRGKYTKELAAGRSCKDRREAVLKLDSLGDKRAIPALRHALDRDDNGCLRKDAREVIARLKKR